MSIWLAIPIAITISLYLRYNLLMGESKILSAIPCGLLSTFFLATDILWWQGAIIGSLSCLATGIFGSILFGTNFWKPDIPTGDDKYDSEGFKILFFVAPIVMMIIGAIVGIVGSLRTGHTILLWFFFIGQNILLLVKSPSAFLKYTGGTVLGGGISAGMGYLIALIFKLDIDFFLLLNHWMIVNIILAFVARSIVGVIRRVPGMTSRGYFFIILMAAISSIPPVLGYCIGNMTGFLIGLSIGCLWALNGYRSFFKGAIESLRAGESIDVA